MLLNSLATDDLQKEFIYVYSAITGDGECKEVEEAYGNTNDNLVIESIENKTAMENMKCNMCGIGCGTKLNLKTHMRIKHTKNEMIAIIMSRGGCKEDEEEFDELNGNVGI